MLAEDPVWENTGVPDLATAVALDATVGRINAIKYPLLAAPAFTKSGAAFAAELAVSTPISIVASLEDADAGVTCALDVREGDRTPTRVWADVPDLEVVHYEMGVPADCPVGLYDFRFEQTDPNAWDLTTGDSQPNAVRVMDATRFDALASGVVQPRIIVLADPQVGDPRAFQDGFEHSLAEQSPAPFARSADGVLGDLSEGEDGRWKAIRHAFAEARALDPDFVLIAGDLGFGQAVPNSYAVEYEEIHRVLREAEVPIIAAPGNHDGYVQNGVDGFAYWRAYIGPTYFLAPTVPGTSVLVMNTYDWSEMDRIGLSLAVSSWGGQVRETQLDWMHDSLTALRASSPNERVVSVSHHSPSWRQDHYFDADPTGFTEHADGVPVLEQASRGVVTFGITDQAWSGENRLELRDLLRHFDVEVAFAGHTHRDRVARDDGVGRIVETHQSSYGMPEDYDPRDLHYFTRDDALIPGYSQSALAEKIRTDPGPLYVETTTVMSGTSQYWGYRHVEFGYTTDGHLDLPMFGYPLTQAELDALAVSPELFNVAHAELGLFSTPLHLDEGMPWMLLADG